MDKNLLDLYPDYLLSSFSYTTATGLSALLNIAVSHDKVTRFLSSTPCTSSELWRLVKPLVRKVQRGGFSGLSGKRSLHKRRRKQRCSPSFEQRSDTDLRPDYENLPKTVESRGVSQIPKAQCIINQVSDQNCHNTDKSLFCICLCFYQTGNA